MRNRLRSIVGRKTFGILAAVFVGGLLRHLFLEEMEFKLDEKYMYLAVRKAMDEGLWPALGMPSGATIRNPGMSIWVFNVLGFLFQVQDPLDLGRAVAWLNTAAIGLLGVFILRKIPQPAQAAWWWGMAIAAVNPLLVTYHRKIWTQSVLSFFCVLFLWAYWDRRKRIGAFFWGLIGPCLGQIHMSGFFFAFAFFLSALFKREDRKSTAWGSWLAGSVLGSLPMIPWLIYLRGGASGRGGLQALFVEFSELRFWSFWFSDPTGLSLGYLLGLHRGVGQWIQNGEFMKYPFLGELPTYGAAFFMVVSLVLSLAVFGMAAWNILKKRSHRQREDFDAETHQAIWNAGGLYGAIVPFSLARVRRHYLLITFPLEYVWFCREAIRGFGRYARWALGALVLLQLGTSIAFLQFIVRNGGGPEGDYGTSYRVQEERGETWRDPIQILVE
jgi:4-amino-4-deoxy-L-arabinose transferase-like glycosyltransferase